MDIKAFRGLSGTYNVRANELDRSAPRNIECLVQFLNNSQHKFVISRRSKGQCLLDCVFKHLNLIETDFFGLKFIPQESHRQHHHHHHHHHHRANSSINNSNSSIQKCNNNNNNNILLTKTQSLSSYDKSPSSNTSLVSSSPPPPPTQPPTQQQQPPPSSALIASNNSNHLSIGSGSQNNLNNNHISTPNNNDNAKSNTTNLNNQSNGDHNNDAHSATTTFMEERWLDPTKSIRKQYKSGPPYKFYFRVKFYVSDPGKLADDTTKNHFFLQLIQDILSHRLFVPTSSAIILASYILQSEIGDYRRELQDENYASNIKLLPNQSDEIRKKVIEFHKQHKSLSSTDAKFQFLDHAAKKLDFYGVEFYEAKDFSKTDVQIGVSSNGIVVFKDNNRMSQFSWAKIVKIMFKKKIFSIQVRKDQGEACDNFIEFNLLTNQACKSFWEECVAQHSFFRLHQPKSPPKKFFSFLNFGSKFQYNGKTEYQTMEESRKRSFSHFSRTPSKRYARRTIPIGRPSWAETSSQQSEDVKNNRKSLDDTDSQQQLKFNGNGNDNDNDNAIEERNDSFLDKQDNCTVTRGDATSNNSWFFTHQLAVASCSSACTTRSADNCNLLNPSPTPKSSGYRPKSLTLKSFIYIDESKNVSSNEQSQNSCHFDQTTITNVSENGVATGDQNDCGARKGENNVSKKDLKRSESLRISNSIKEAISLTKKAGVSSGTQLIRISESLRDKFLVGKSKIRKSAKMTKIEDNLPKTQQHQHHDSDDLETNSETSSRLVRLTPGEGGRYGFKIRDASKLSSDNHKRTIIIYDFAPNSPAARCPKLFEYDQLVSINGISTNNLSETEVETLIKNIQTSNEPEITMEVYSRYSLDSASISSSLNSQCSNDAQSSLASDRSSNSKKASGFNQVVTLDDSIKDMKQKLSGYRKVLIEEFDRLSRKNENETLEESKLSENIDKNRYRDILPYDSTRVQLHDSMTGDYINASFVDMPVPSGRINRYIATQGPLSSTCEDFWQMVWEQNCSLIIMVTPLIEAGRVKCHKYWPDEKEEVRYGQILVKNLSEKSKSATIDRTIQLVDVKSGQKRTTSQIQYKAWQDHGVPDDCSDFLKLVSRVRKHRKLFPEDPVVVHCSAGIGRTGVLILMETSICIMESGEPVFPIKILQEMRDKRAMLIQTSGQFQFVCDAICQVYDQKHKKFKKHKKMKIP